VLRAVRARSRDSIQGGQFLLVPIRSGKEARHRRGTLQHPGIADEQLENGLVPKPRGHASQAGSGCSGETLAQRLGWFVASRAVQFIEQKLLAFGEMLRGIALAWKRLKPVIRGWLAFLPREPGGREPSSPSQGE